MSAKFWLILTGIGLSLLGLVLVLTITAYLKEEPWRAVLTHIGSIMIGAGAVELIVSAFATNSLVSHVKDGVLGALNLPIEKFYVSRDGLESIDQATKDAKEVWAVWHTGTIVSTTNLFKNGIKGRVILMNPERSLLEELAKITIDRTADGMQSDILETTRSLRLNKVEVRWFRGPIQNSTTIVDPCSPYSWITVELLIPHLTSRKRPSFRISKSHSQELYNTIFDSYTKMWEKSETPPDNTSNQQDAQH
ncbi:MAG: hypothetical protein AB1597_02775 [Chloroflexota bacterium]